MSTLTLMDRTFEFDILNTELEIYQDESGDYWFHGATLCDIFDFTNSTQDIQRHVDEDWRKKYPFRGREAWYIAEPGLYQLIHASKNPAAKRFQRWVYSEVLPKLRAEGGYIMPSATAQQLKSLQNQIVNQRSIIDGWEQHLDRVEIESRRIGSLIEKKHSMSNHAVLAAQVDLYGWCHFAIQHKEKARIVAEAFRSEKLGSWQSVAHLKGIFERATGGYVGVRILAAWLIEWGFDVRSYDCNTYSLEVRCNKLYGPKAKKIEISISIPKSDRKIQWISVGSPPVQIASTEGN